MLRSKAPRNHFTKFLVLSTLWLSVCWGACSNSTNVDASADSGGQIDSGQVSCLNDPRVDSYAAGMQRTGTAGLIVFRITRSDPAPPAKGGNTFVVQLFDTLGAPAAANLGVDLIMPDHGHGTSVVPTITFDSATQSFTVTPLYLFMAGVWRIDLRAHATGVDAGTVLDSASLFFCIEG
jgi:hypothetical protein